MALRKPLIPHFDAGCMAVQDDLPAHQPRQPGVVGVLVEGPSGSRMDVHDLDSPVPQEAPAQGEEPAQVVPQLVRPVEPAGGRDERECLEGFTVRFQHGYDPAMDRIPITLSHGQYAIAYRLVDQNPSHTCPLLFPSRRVSRLARSYRCRWMRMNQPFFSSERQGFASSFASTSGKVSFHIA